MSTPASAIRLAALAAASVTLATAPVASAAAVSTAGSSTGWHRVSAETPARHDNVMFDAAFVASATDAWVSGEHSSPGQAGHKAVIEHWAGSSFAAQDTARIPHADDTWLAAMDGTGPADVWAVGLQDKQGQPSHGLIEHWNGTRWEQSAEPTAEPAGSQLQGVSADSATDVWAVGNSNAGAGITPLIEHFDGTSWRVSQGLPKIQTLFAVDAVTPTDVWALGFLNDDTPPLIEHFNGTAWEAVDQPVHAPDTALNSLSDLGPDNIWAVGQTGVHTLVEHWNGHQWSVVPSVDGGYVSALTSVTALSTDDIWAVGSTSSGQAEPLVEHWDGDTWTSSQVPASGSSDQLSSVSGVADGPTMIAGSLVQGTQPYLRRGLVLRHR